MFRDPPASWFPFEVTAYALDDTEGRTPLWSARVTGPGALRVPKLGPAWTRIRLADGRVMDSRG
jgi:hypothetical protein